MKPILIEQKCNHPHSQQRPFLGALRKLGAAAAIGMLLPGCATSPDGRLEQTDAVADIAMSLINGRRIDPVFIVRRVAVAGIRATAADQKYAMTRARTYHSRSSARYVAVRTKSSRGASKPRVIVVDTNDHQPVDDREYVLNTTPAPGEQVDIENYKAEYLY